MGMGTWRGREVRVRSGQETEEPVGTRTCSHEQSRPKLPLVLRIRGS